MDNTKCTVHVLDKYSVNKEEEFSGSKGNEQLREVTVSYNEHLCWYSNYGLLRADYEPTVCGKYKRTPVTG
jgi:hypothetical protein